jgi:hypothetical protein
MTIRTPKLYFIIFFSKTNEFTRVSKNKELRRGLKSPFHLFITRIMVNYKKKGDAIKIISLD